MVIPLLVSLLLHAAAFLSIQSKPSPAPIKPPPAQGKSTVRIKIKSDEKLITQSTKGTRKCDNYYTGIGVTQWGECEGWCEINEVSHGGPAYKVGIRPGSYVYCDASGCPGRGPEGSKISVTFKSSIVSDPVTRIITREKICTVR